MGYYPSFWPHTASVFYQTKHNEGSACRLAHYIHNRYFTQGRRWRRWVQGLGTPIRARGDPWDSRKSSKKCARGGGTWMPDARRWIFCHLAYTACTCVRVSMATPILHSDGRSGHQRLTTVSTHRHVLWFTDLCDPSSPPHDLRFTYNIAATSIRSRLM